MSLESSLWARSFAKEEEIKDSAPISIPAPKPIDPKTQLVELWEKIKNDKSLSSKNKAQIIKSSFPSLHTTTIVRTIGWPNYRFWQNSEETILKTKQSAEQVRKQRKDLIIKSKESIGGCCVCGYSKCLEALGFYPIGDGEKGKPLYKIHNTSLLEEEIKKCVLLCANCHREYHAGLIDLPKNHK